jgi:hypothetical protein
MKSIQIPERMPNFRKLEKSLGLTVKITVDPITEEEYVAYEVDSNSRTDAKLSKTRKEPQVDDMVGAIDCRRRIPRVAWVHWNSRTMDVLQLIYNRSVPRN